MISKIHTVEIDFDSSEDGLSTMEVKIAIGNYHGIAKADVEKMGIHTYVKDDAAYRRLFMRGNGKGWYIRRELSVYDVWTHTTTKGKDYRLTWWRLGCSAVLTQSELDAMRSGDDDTLQRLFREGRFILDGESYIPEDCEDCGGGGSYGSLTVNVIPNLGD